MEFWGVEVKPGQPLKVNLGEDKLLHLSQASLGESKKDKASENVLLFAEVDDQKIVIGTLSLDKIPQISYDLVFEKEFNLTHNSKNTSVHFCGYKTVPDIPEFASSDSDSEEDEDLIPLGPSKANGKPEKKEELAKPATSKPVAAKSDAAPPKLNKPANSKPEEDDDDSDDEDDDSDEDMLLPGDEDSDDDDDDDDSEDDEEDEETPKKINSDKKRPLGSASKTPVPEKKAKIVSPGSNQKGGDGKKGGGHVATPYPSKQAGKMSAAADKSKDSKQQKTPKSAGTATCTSCSKTFNSDAALQSHNKAKHAGK